jgi:hypothetical protein
MRSWGLGWRRVCVQVVSVCLVRCKKQHIHIQHLRERVAYVYRTFLFLYCGGSAFAKAKAHLGPYGLWRHAWLVAVAAMCAIHVPMGTLDTPAYHRPPTTATARRAAPHGHHAEHKHLTPWRTRPTKGLRK